MHVLIAARTHVPLRLYTCIILGLKGVVLGFTEFTGSTGMGVQRLVLHIVLPIMKLRIEQLNKSIYEVSMHNRNPVCIVEQMPKSRQEILHVNP